MEDEIFIAKLKKGDSAAFETLLFQYEKKVYAMAFRFCGNEQDAMDISQEVFLRVFRFIGSFGGKSALSTWIYRITHNTCKDFLIKKGRSKETPLVASSEEGDTEIDIADERYSPEKTLESIAVKEEIKDAILALPPIYKEVIILREINDLSYAQIAEILGVEQGTVKSRIARARESLRSFLLKGGNFLSPVRSNNVKGGE